MSNKILHLAENVEGLFIRNGRFKTTQISCNFYVPFEKENVANNALLPFILTSCSKKYPDFSRLNYKLSKLYGASLDASAEKYGDYQLLRMTVSVINDSYTIDNEPLAVQAVELLLGLIFEPSIENGEFFEEDVKREKRKAIEHIKGEYSEKRIYAKNRLIEEMFKGENYGISKCGTVEDVEKITGKSLYEAWKNMLSSAFIRFHVVGANIPSGLFETISEKFEGFERNTSVDCTVMTPKKSIEKPQRVTDYEDVTQGKLVMGFTSEMFGNDEVSLPLLVMCDVFGSGPYSRLFSNVREKMSLCYYCSSSSVRQKGIMTVESGVETENAEKAEKEILNQLEIMKKGEFSDFEFESSIKSICDSFMAFEDSLGTLDMWYAQKVNSKVLYTPEELVERIKKVTREEVVAAAKGIKLHTIYKLLPREVK